MHYTHKRIFSFIILFAFFLISGTSYATPKQYTSIEDFIQKQNIIRVCMTDGPNYGDQAGSMNVMNALRKIGFSGTFEVIYDKNIADKISTLFALPTPLPAVYEDQVNKITFLEMAAQNDRIKNNAVPLVDLGLSVGKAYTICDLTETGMPTEPNTKVLIQFSPYFDSRGGSHDTTDIEQSDGNQISQYNSGKKYFVFPVATYDDAKNYLLNNQNGKILLEQKPALMTFLEGMERKDFNVLPIYGRTLRFDTSGDELKGSTSPSNILQTILGARYAQIHGSVDLQKGLVITMFDNYQPYAETLLQLLRNSNWGDYEKEGADQARQVIQNLQLSDVLSIADISDIATIDKIKSLQKGQILLLSLGTFPKVVFDGLYTYTNTNILPEVREGAASFSALITTGRPHFECGDAIPKFTSYNWMAGFDLISDENLKTTMETFYDTQNGYCGCTYDSNYKPNCLVSWEKYNNYQQFGEFVMAAQDFQSPFSQYFKTLQADVLKPENDRIRYALEGVVEILNK